MYDAEDTIISWNDRYAKTDVALSFQEPSGCSAIWDHIQAWSQTNTAGVLPMHIANGIPEHDDLLGDVLDEYHRSTQRGLYGDVYDAAAGHMARGVAIREGIRTLPEPRLDNLEDIATIINETSVFQRESLAQLLLKPGYMRAVLECFGTAEDLEEEQSIKHAHAIVKGSIMLNDTTLLELMFSEENIELVVAALEYDSGLSQEHRGKYREHVRGDMSLKEVVPITDPICRSKIMQAHRIMFIRDTMLPKSLDDGTYSTLSSMYLFNIVEVLVSLHNDAAFFKNLFSSISESEKGSSDWRDLINFLQELVALSRHIQASQRNDILMHLCNLGLFHVMSDVLLTEDSQAKTKAIDTVLATAIHDPVLLRSFIQNNDAGSIIFDQLITSLLNTSQSGLQEQALDVIKIILDPDTMENNDIKEKFIGLFYEKHVARLMEAISEGVPDYYYSGSRGTPVGTLMLVIELLSYCISQHSYRIKYFILRNNLVDQILQLLERPEKALAAGAIRFLKTCILMKDEFYNRYLVKNNLLEPVLRAYLKHCHKENLVHSAILDLLDLLRRDNVKSLLALVVNNPLWNELETIDCDRKIFESIRSKHQSNQEDKMQPEGQTSLPGLPVDGHSQDAWFQERRAAAEKAMRAKGEREEDVDEENYFSRDADEINDSQQQIILEDDTPPHLPGLLPRLVDYDDDDTIPLKAVPSASLKRKSSPKIQIIPTEKKQKEEPS